MKQRRIGLHHGNGGKQQQELLEEMISPLFSGPLSDLSHDGAVLPMDAGEIAFTTDSFVVDPLFFPGGNIGDLAVNGTVNDLAMCGAVPNYLSLALIIEEGLLFEDLEQILGSIKTACDKAGVEVVTGDTKVVQQGKGDKLFINTAGIGRKTYPNPIGPRFVKPGDLILINGTVGDHGLTILAEREKLKIEAELKSDTASLASLVQEILTQSNNIHMLRDPTRGGLASTLNEIAQVSGLHLSLDEDRIPLSEGVRACCGLLGIDPLQVANEGKVLVFCPQEERDKVLSAMKSHPLGKQSAVIGQVTADEQGLLTLKTSIGTERIVQMPTGEQLPRIC